MITYENTLSDDEYTTCESCGDKILKGEVRYVEHNGKEVCEYCYDTEMEMENY